MKIELFYYKFLSVLYNLLPRCFLKDKLCDYAISRFPEVHHDLL